MTFDARNQAAFSLAGDTTKQVLALAIATIGGSIALFDDADLPGLSLPASHTWLFAGLLLLSLSVASGLFAIGALVGQLGAETASPSVYAKGVAFFYFGQLVTYGLGVIAVVLQALL